MGVLVRPALVHEGVARSLVHRLKYDASPAVASVLAAAMAPLVPADAAALVPVPRVIARRWRYGVDPARELTFALGARIALPVVDALRPAVWTARRAGPGGRPRGHPRFTAVGPAPESAVLVDDVLTTGATLAAAAAVLGVRRAVVATAALRG
jgi:predicted amidophosphoribosyltransferase